MDFQNGMVSGGVGGGMAAMGYILFGVTVMVVVLLIQYSAKSKPSDH